MNALGRICRIRPWEYILFHFEPVGGSVNAYGTKVARLEESGTVPNMNELVPPS